MATWRDGPAYAPKERPAAFAQPEATVSLAPSPPPPPAPPPPPLPPAGFMAPATDLPPLAALAARREVERDPTAAFDTVTTTITQPGSAWGSVHNTAPRLDLPLAAPVWTADKPWQSQYSPPPAVNGQFPAPGTPQWFATGPVEQHKPATVPVTVQTLAESVGLPYLIVLVLGVLLPSVGPFSLSLAFGCVQVTRYRRSAMRWALGGAWLFTLVFWLFSDLAGLGLGSGLPFQLGCALAAVGGVLIQYLALKAGDRPTWRG